MNNKESLKKIIICELIVFVIFLVSLLFINNYYYKEYNYNYNKKIASIVSILKDKGISDEEIANILNSDKDYDLSKYGIDINDESIIIENDNNEDKKVILEVVICLLFLIVTIILYLYYDKKKEKRINEISSMIDEISRGNYLIDFDSKSEDELSILRDILYKITLKLKEESTNSLNDKKNIKESLEDISHQLKTPLTAIMISIDNILDNSKISDTKRREFLIDIKREVNNINFLVKSLLELSRFDTNVVVYNKKDNKIKKIIKESINRVDLLRELKNIKININGNDFIIDSDYNWEVEAISNLLKNAIEHSSRKNKVDIELFSNKVYSSIKIINYCERIDSKELKNLFKRFYKGSNSSFDSVGIGLALSKAIIEKDNGKIFVESNDDYTVFEIKYYR